jgi:hypothetical protein
MKDNEHILTFNLRFIKSYNSIPTSIRPTNLAALLHYYELLPHNTFPMMDHTGLV